MPISKKKMTIRLSLVSAMAGLIFVTAATILGVATITYRNSINWVLETLSQKVVSHIIDKISVNNVYSIDGTLASTLIRDIDLSKNEHILVLQEDFTIIASVERQDGKFLPDRFTNKGIKLPNTKDDLLIRSFQKFKSNIAKQNREILKRKFDHFPFWYDYQKYFAIYTDFQLNTGKVYYVGVIVPYRDFFSSFTRNNIILYSLVILFVVISVLVSLRISSKISEPLMVLAKETEKIRNLELDSNTQVLSPILEVENMSDSIDKMRSGLKSFRKYVPADLVRELINQGKEAALGGEKKELTVFFSDIAGFTSISEKLPPEKLVTFLGEYLGNMTKVIMSNKGTVDKYIGDAIMAFWGAPIDVQNHAELACLSALKLQEVQEQMRAQAKEKNHPDFFSRMGINTGELIVGNMGYEDRMNYTVIGDTVNLASRIEGINKIYGTRILVGENTEKEVGNKFEFKKIDIVAVKGKKKGVSIFELIDIKGKINKNRIENRNFYHEAFDHYLNKNFTRAIDLFKKAQGYFPQDIACDIFVSRCEQLIQNPPKENWDGVYISKEK